MPLFFLASRRRKRCIRTSGTAATLRWTAVWDSGALPDKYGCEGVGKQWRWADRLFSLIPTSRTIKEKKMSNKQN